MYILDTELTDHKIVTEGFKDIYGIGNTQSLNICKKLGLSKNFKIKNLSKDKLTQLTFLLNSDFKMKISGELKKLEAFRYQKILSIKSYRGLRRAKGLPVRGQRTHTNAKTAKKRN